MRVQIALFLALAVALSQTGCGGGVGGSDYDGSWAVSYNGAATTGCTNPIGTIFLAQAQGSAQLTQTCTTGAASSVVSTSSGLSISVAINGSTGVMNAIVNGAAFTGKCISTTGCSAQASTGTASVGMSR